MTMISDLPSDVVVEILSRVSLRFMRAVRLTCKHWNTLSNNPRFSKMHIDKEKASTKGESQMIVMMNKNLYLMSVVNNGDPYIELKGKLTCLAKQAQVYQIFNYEGLLLCIFQEDEYTKLMVWNPYCTQPNWFEPKCFCTRLKYLYCYGLGYVEKRKNKTCGRSHKILRFIDTNYLGRLFSYQIYDLDSDSWTTFDITPRSIRIYDLGVSVKGNTYWSSTVVNGRDIYIICFDFTRERFGKFMHLPFNARLYVDKVILSCVGEEKLAALQQHDRPNLQELEIWITTMIETENLSWSKFLTVNMGPEISGTLESFIIDEEKKVIIGFDDKIIIIGESGYFKDLNLGEPAGIRYKQHLCAYVPNLLQNKQLAEGKRNKQRQFRKSFDVIKRC